MNAESFELLSDGHPVTITRDPDERGRLRATLAGITIEWSTDADESPTEELRDLQDDMTHCYKALRRAVSMEKLVQSVRQGLAVAYALRHSITVTEAWTALALDHELPDVSAVDGEQAAQEISTARAEAQGLLDAQLRAHGWREHGPTLGDPRGTTQDQLLDLASGRTATLVEDVVSVPDESTSTGNTLEGLCVWRDENDEDLPHSTSGVWWGAPSRRMTLPWDPWEMEAHLEAQHRETKG